VVSRRDSSGLGGIVALGRDSGRLGGGIVASKRGAGGLGGAMTGPRRVRAFVSCIGRFLAKTLGSRGCNAFLFLVDFAVHAQQEAQVLSSLLARLDGSERKQESRRF
jgi:hypothetical protein